MKILSINRHSERDYPGKRSAVLYAQGCNLRCPYCCNAEYLVCREDCPDIPWENVMSFLEARRGKLEAVVFSGGEPTIHPDLAEKMEAVKNLGFLIKLDTNGTQPEVLRHLLSQGLLDYLAVDIKAPFENYGQLAGRRVDVEAIRNTIWIVKHSGTAHEFRTTVVPGMHTTRELKKIAELIHGAERYVVQDFVSTHPLRPELQGRPAFPSKPLEDIRRYVERRVKTYEIRHHDDARKMPLPRRRRRTNLIAS